MKLTAEQRRVRFSSLDNDTKAFLVRSHAREWLSRNQAKLSKSEVALFEEAISMVSSETYDRPSDPQLGELEAKLKAKMRCRVNPSDVVAAFSLFRTQPGTSRYTYLDRAKCWLEWFVEGTARKVPEESR